MPSAIALEWVVVPSLASEAMKYLWVGLILASIASMEFYHELASGNLPGGSVCIVPEAQQDAMRDLLLQHLKSH
jgi:hypothetical protein